jgi:hypothetical protein
MDSVLIAFIGKFNSWQLLVLIAGLIYVAVHIKPRKDENGKKTWKAGVYWYRESYEKNQDRKYIKQILKDTRDIKLENLKQNVFLENLPIGERMASAIRYVRAGGNGDCHDYIVNELIPRNQDLYDELEKLIGNDK